MEDKVVQILSGAKQSSQETAAPGITINIGTLTVGKFQIGGCPLLQKSSKKKKGARGKG